ncbi:helicase [Streptomyces sp. CB01635]|uniref:DEAD/DEAH box helicase n=1 Tax=unclassified Streptomyces TaxID=2593676 RepID=UPI000C270891|nr:DEAD/DEAH box helicase [Streptomyces sp. CB01635]PJN05901.1 helicase [Streptomyces sp. CB01635]
MAAMKLLPHQVEAVDGILRELQKPTDGNMPTQGLRAQVVSATGSGKTLMAVEAARRLKARRVLVLVPTLDLLMQTAAAWRAGGRGGAMVGVCSLSAADSQGVPCTTSAEELRLWLRGLEQVTVFATYASLGLRTLQRAHGAGVGVWDLVVVDEAHRTSGDAGKPWAAVHDQRQIPAQRRLYMTATPRVWEAGGEMPGMVASMDRDSELFGPVAYELKLSEAIRRGIVAPYQVVCVDIRDEDVHQALQGEPLGSDHVRGARLAALQTGLLTAAVEEKLRRILTFHSRVAEAEAMAAGVPAVAEQLHADDPDRFPAAGRVWAQWLYGEHSPGHRQAVLQEFASDFIWARGEGGQGCGGREVKAAVQVLGSVKVLGEGVDTARCDAVAFCDARGSMVDIVQMVGRALRIQPGEGKLATLVVPVFLGPGEEGGEMLVSNSYDTLSKVLGALRAHDTETIEALADPRVRSGSWVQDGDQGEVVEGAVDEQGDSGEDVAGGEGAEPVVSGPAAELLKFSTPRDPALIAQFISLRIIDPENSYWRRGIQAAIQYLKESGAQVLQVPQRYVTPDDWSPARFPLGVWLADQRKHYNAELLEGERVRQLDKLGMVWNAHDNAFDEGLAHARAWAEEHGHLLAPVGAVGEGGFPVGVWLKNQRAAARQAVEAALAYEQGQLVPAGGWGLSESRQDALDAIDPGWCPTWDTGWQRCFRLAKNHIDAGGILPREAGVLVVQGEDLGVWVKAQRLGWDKLGAAQQWLLESVLGVEEAGEDERPVRRTQDDKWMLNLAAARRFHAREGHLQVPRKHIEQVSVEEAGHGAAGVEAGSRAGVEGVPVALGMFLANTRRRADKLTPQRRADLEALGMRW